MKIERRKKMDAEGIKDLEEQKIGADYGGIKEGGKNVIGFREKFEKNRERKLSDTKKNKQN